MSESQVAAPKKRSLKLEVKTLEVKSAPQCNYWNTSCTCSGEEDPGCGGSHMKVAAVAFF